MKIDVLVYVKNYCITNSNLPPSEFPLYNLDREFIRFYCLLNNKSPASHKNIRLLEQLMITAGEATHLLYYFCSTRPLNRVWGVLDILGRETHYIHT